jgi:hypothetical protein
MPLAVPVKTNGEPAIWTKSAAVGAAPVMPTPSLS